jgi:hypothetical protein
VEKIPDAVLTRGAQKFMSLQSKSIPSLNELRSLGQQSDMGAAQRVAPPQETLASITLDIQNIAIELLNESRRLADVFTGPIGTPVSEVEKKAPSSLIEVHQGIRRTLSLAYEALNTAQMALGNK